MSTFTEYTNRTDELDQIIGVLKEHDAWSDELNVLVSSLVWKQVDLDTIFYAVKEVGHLRIPDFRLKLEAIGMW